MRALVLSVVMLMSAVASAQAQGLSRPPPPGQGTGPAVPAQPSPPVAVPGYNNGPGYDDWEVPEGFRRRGSLVVVEREQIMDRLARMEEQLGRAMERADRNSRDALRKVREEMNGIRGEVSNAPDLRSFRRRASQPVPMPTPAPAPTVYPISEDQLQQLIKAMARESFGDGKIRVLESAAPSQYFLVPQVLKILKGFSFGDDKLDAVRTLWPRVLDRDNAFQLYGAFNFQGEKDELKQIIGR
jgi:hypothetical protein